ncbi:MAG TPA: sigma 54-interacting transcriptional regulator [Nitrospiraceae bacterium]|nr:sigma 54-interacting transcriptional regulator [Nitrospiraceae bacterium]
MAQQITTLDDPNRLVALRSYEILNTQPEPAFDRLAKLAAHVCGTPYAAITFLDGARQFFKATVGFSEGDTSSAPGFCCEAVSQPELFVVPDATKDERFATHPLVTGSAQVRFYAGIPLTTVEGHALGTLCVLDRTPRQLTKEQADALLALAGEVVTELELRRTRKSLAESTFRQDPFLLARHKADEFLRALLEGTISSTGTDFLHELVRHVAAALGIRYSFVGHLLPGSRIRTLAFWKGDGFMDQFEYDLDGTPCTNVIAGETCHYAQDVQKLFPRDRDLVTMGVSSYLAVPLKDPKGKVLGHLVAMDVKPMNLTSEEITVFKLFGERAGVEIYRQVMEWALKEQETMLRAITESTVPVVGEEFFQALVKNVAIALGVDYAYISEMSEDRSKFRSKAGWGKGEPLPPFDVPAKGPCETVLTRHCVHHPDQLRALYPHVQLIQESGVDSYCGVPVVDLSGRVLGHLAIMDSKPMPDEARVTSILSLFAARAAGEFERLRMEAQLKEDEERLRDLFDEAPIAYVNEGLDSKFIRANKTAMKSLGITPDQVEGTYGASFIPDTPDAQRRLKEAFASIGKGIDTSGVVLELRRRDNGKPLWIKWWSRPDPSGTYTRTMFVDITEQVLMEQEKARLEAQNVYLQEEIKGSHNFEELIGSSTSLKKVLKNVERVAPTDSTILITGDTGTGKELIARAIHNLSQRKGRPLVKVNCAAIPAGLIESELFGHEKGAFTGALAKKMGRFELADKGTIFLDEIGELPLDLQSKLLRVLQEGEFERVGGTQTFKVNVRVIAATNRDLEQQSKQGHYRPDLYYRLNVFPIHLPALREREGDIPLLVQYFVRKFAANLGKKIDRIPERMMAALQRYQWPGNIRELEHVVERAVILSEGTELEPIEWLSQPGGKAGPGKTLTLEEMERQHIVDVLEHTNWRVSGEKGAAKILGLNPTTLEARMKKLGITRGKRET